MVASGRKRKKKREKKKRKEKKRRPYRRRWVYDESLGNSAIAPALNLVRKSVRYKKCEKKKKNKVLDFVKLEYYKEVFDFYNIEYHITFLIAQISGQQCHVTHLGTRVYET